MQVHCFITTFEEHTSTDKSNNGEECQRVMSACTCRYMRLVNGDDIVCRVPPLQVCHFILESHTAVACHFLMPIHCT